MGDLNALASTMKFVFVIIIFILFVWRISRGFSNGILQEVVSALSAVIALACAVLVIYAVHSFISGEKTNAALCVFGLILLGVFFKIFGLITSPILALGEIPFIREFNKLLGAVLGAIEAGVLVYLLYKVLEHMNIYVW
jgi:membrane protein required for colicin V production